MTARGAVGFVCLVLSTLHCYASHPGWVEPDGERSDDRGADDAPEADAPEADVPETCVPPESIDREMIMTHPERYEGREAWVHGYGGPHDRFCSTSHVCRNDACCIDCAAGYGLDGLEVLWSAGTEPACAGNDCRLACTPWPAGTEMYVHGVLSGLSWDGGLLTAAREPCLVGAESPVGAWQVRVRSMDFARCPSPIIATGLEGDFDFWYGGETPMARLSFHPIAETAWDLAGSFDGTTLVAHSTRDCEHCPCVFDVRATFDGTSSIVGTAYIEQDCECVAAFSFEGGYLR